MKAVEEGDHSGLRNLSGAIEKAVIDGKGKWA